MGLFNGIEGLTEQEKDNIIDVFTGNVSDGFLGLLILDLLNGKSLDLPTIQSEATDPTINEKYVFVEPFTPDKVVEYLSRLVGVGLIAVAENQYSITQLSENILKNLDAMVATASQA